MRLFTLLIFTAIISCKDSCLITKLNNLPGVYERLDDNGVELALYTDGAFLYSTANGQHGSKWMRYDTITYGRWSAESKNMITPQKEHDQSTGNTTRISYEGTSARSDLKGEFVTEFTSFFKLEDNSKSPPGQNIFSREVGVAPEITKEPLTEEQANKLLKLAGPYIRIDRGLGDKEFAKVLAHELGHAAWTIKNIAIAFFRPGPVDSKQHDTGNPNGEAAVKAEKQLEKNYNKASKTHQLNAEEYYRLLLDSPEKKH